MDMAVAAAQQAAALRAAESRAQAAMMVEAVEDRAYEVQLLHTSLQSCLDPTTPRRGKLTLPNVC